VTRYVIPEVCANIVYSIVFAKRDAFRDASSICKTRVTSVTVMGGPYLVVECPLSLPLSLAFLSGKKGFVARSSYWMTTEYWGNMCSKVWWNLCHR
jgi:hypothetical protein